MDGLGVELVKGFLESAGIDPTRHVACCSFVENRPTADRLAHGLSDHPPKDKRCGVLGFENELFEPPSGNDAEIRVGHINPTTTYGWKSKAKPRLLRHRPRRFGKLGLQWYPGFGGSGPADRLGFGDRQLLPVLFSWNRSKGYGRVSGMAGQLPCLKVVVRLLVPAKSPPVIWPPRAIADVCLSDGRHTR